MHTQKTIPTDGLGRLKEFLLPVLVAIITITSMWGYRQSNLTVGLDGTVTESIKISAEEAYFQFLGDTALLIDARETRFYEGLRIPDAICLPFNRRIEWEKTILKDRPKDAIIIVYCDSRICSLSMNLAVYLRDVGFTQVFYIGGGIESWRAEGYPVMVHSELRE